MEYKILKYKVECTIQNLIRNTIRRPKEWESEGRIGTDYYHEDFGLVSDEDAENALAHAIGAIDDLSVKKMRHTLRVPPKLFVLPLGTIQIKEIIFGPKFENAVNLMPYLREQLEIMAEKTSTEIPKVTFSNIEFR